MDGPPKPFSSSLFGLPWGSAWPAPVTGGNKAPHEGKLSLSIVRFTHAVSHLFEDVRYDEKDKIKFVAEFEGNEPTLEAHLDVPDPYSYTADVYLAMAGGEPNVPDVISDRVFRASIPNEIHVVVPSVGVALSGFRDVTNLRRVTFGASSCIEYFDEDCFAGSGIVEIFVPDSVKGIGARCFADCASLRRVLFGPFSTLEYIESEAFSRIYYDNESEVWCSQGCDLETLYMPDSLLAIGDRAFEECHLEDIVFSPTSKLESIGEMCFAGTGGGGSCTLPAGVDIGWGHLTVPASMSPLQAMTFAFSVVCS